MKNKRRLLLGWMAAGAGAPALLLAQPGRMINVAVLFIGDSEDEETAARPFFDTMAKLKVTATASRAESIAWCKQLGADEVIDHAQVGGEEFDFVLCFNASDAYWPSFPKITRPQGRIGLIVRTLKPVDLQILHDKSISVHLEGMFTRSTFQTQDMEAQHALLDEMAGLIEAGVVTGTLKQNLGAINAANLRRAHKLLEEGHVTGKLVLEGCAA